MAKDFKNGYDRVRAAALNAGVITGDEGEDEQARLIAVALGEPTDPEPVEADGELGTDSEPEA